MGQADVSPVPSRRGRVHGVLPEVVGLPRGDLVKQARFIYYSRADSCSGPEIQRRKRLVSHFHRLLNQVGMNGSGFSSGGGSGWFWGSSLLMVSFICRLVSFGARVRGNPNDFIGFVRIRGLAGTSLCGSAQSMMAAKGLCRIKVTGAAKPPQRPRSYCGRRACAGRSIRAPRQSAR